MKKVRLADICDIVIGRTPSRSVNEYWGKGYKWASIADMKQEVIISTKEEITEEAIRSIRCRKIPKGSLLLSFKLSVGKLAFAGTDLYTNEAIAALIVKDHLILNSKYMYYALKTIKLVGGNQAAKGVTLNSKSLAELRIPLPILEDQIRIATILSRAELLIAKRKESINALDELLKSTFMEMFGDPVRNERGWGIVSLKDVCKKVIDCPHNTPQYSDAFTSLYCIRSSDIQNGYLDLNNTLQVDVDTFHQRNLRHIPSYNDIVFTREGGRLGNCARVPKEVNICLGQRVMLFSVDHNIATSEFLWASLNTNSLQHCINNLAGGGAAPRVNIKDLINIKLYLPPLPLQNQFVEIVKKVESLKVKYSQSLIELENLYGSLSQQAFKGILDLSNVPVVYETETEAGEFKLIGSANVEFKPKLEFTNKDLVELIEGNSGKVFSFEELWKEIESLTDKRIPSRTDIQTQIIKLLESDKANLHQVFDFLTSEEAKNDKKKQIAFRGNYEN
ncbi:restriction endonuclease subunit S [Paenibacillus sp. NPDC058174]|uniref:restriction endonuclease subunit S n=1 Tax=Paenibacillus sp. NPDC058174 TaxID=3346366 RepID=UPI0036D9ED80